MKAELRFQARIPVRKAGYRWRGDGATAILGYNDPSDVDIRIEDDEHDPEHFRSYDPFVEEPALFMVFADLEQLGWPFHSLKGGKLRRLRESILGFIDKYGAPHIEGMFIASLGIESRSMRDAIELWQAVVVHDKSAISKYITWSQESGWELSGTPLEQIVDPDSNWIESSHGKNQIFARAAEIVDMATAARCAEELQLAPIRRPGKPLELGIEIDNLLRVVWLQFALAVADNKQYRRCKMCNSPFEVASGENRKDRITCSDACRIRAYRNRKARAQEMRTAGRRLREIAKEVGSDMQTVKRWVGEA